MNKTLAIIICSLLVVVGLLTIWYWRTNPERQIRKTLTTMAELGSSPAGESSIAKAVKSQKLGEYFSEDGFIEWPGDEVIPAGRWTGREQINQQVLAAKNSATYQVSVDDLIIETRRWNRSAAAEFTLVVREGVNTWAWLGATHLFKDGRRWSVTQLIFAPILRR
ncbi:MAG: hypothetical protein HYT46_01335 [Candidatus Vogelbacteria bacterium]|nr:hypothetical protein [Candidatus Vogelbacteria bacterium]